MDYTRFDVPIIDMENQSPKDCKKQTPDYQDANPKKGKAQVGFRVKDKVYVRGLSLVNNVFLEGVFIFDSYDKYDNTCYVLRGTMTYNVLLTDIRLATDIEKMGS